ncbi:MAG: MoxR family ATPase [Chloroflexota bacterium]|nr:MoxR family ATPase [Chloroflexota bacterium]MDE2886343.1 MoxR family ATPase [Chloroflexota bacterium]
MVASKRELDIGGAREIAERLLDNLGKVILGKGDEERLAVMTLMCRGHLLIEDVPGVGKTMLARSIARSIGGSFRRIQFTPDLLPADITGVSVFNQKNGEFEYREGPIAAQVVLADEINRASPKTQAALLEAMEERQVTVDGVAHPMPEPFIVMATQNPIEYEGTFPLPETELDRFLLRLHLGYPDTEDEIRVLEAQQYAHPVEELEAVVDGDELLALQRAVRTIHVSEDVKEYIVAIANATRNHGSLYLGASPRGSLALFRLAQAKSLLEERDYALPDDVKALAYSALGHRIILSSAARIQGTTAADAVAEVLEQTPVAGALPGA